MWPQPLQPLGKMGELAVSKEAKSLRGRVRRSDLVLTVTEYGTCFFAVVGLGLAV